MLRTNKKPIILFLPIVVDNSYEDGYYKKLSLEYTFLILLIFITVFLQLILNVLTPPPIKIFFLKISIAEANNQYDQA